MSTKDDMAALVAARAKLETSQQEVCMTTERLIAWGDELRRVHHRLRDSLRIAREAVEDGTDPAETSGVRDLLLYCRGFCVAITGHHGSESATMFPRIVAERPDLAPVIDELIRDHNMIDHLVGQLERALGHAPDSRPAPNPQHAPDARSGTGGLDGDELLRHLDGIEAVMETHFRYEERMLVEVLNAVHDRDLTATDLFGPIA